MEIFVTNLRSAFRSLGRNPLVTGVVVLTLALGIGANTAVFSVVHGVVFQSLPYSQPERIVRVWPQRNLSRQMVDQMQERLASMAAVTAFMPGTFALTGGDGPEEVQGASVYAEHFDVLGTRPLLGRVLAAADQAPGAPPVVVLSHGLWQRRFAGDPAIIGRSVEIDGARRTVVGVVPPDHRPLAPGWTLWLPLPIDRASDLYRDQLMLDAYGRLAEGVSLDAALVDLRSLVSQLALEEPAYVAEEHSAQASLIPLRESVVGRLESSLWMLVGAAGLVLLIACSNVANLLLARVSGQRRELSLRAALGAGRWRLAGEILTESALLALLGAGVGLLAAVWSSAALQAKLPAAVVPADGIPIDGTVLAFTLGASLVTALIFGLAPALRAARSEAREFLAAGGRSATGDRRSRRLRQSLVAVEIALAVVLVAGAGLMVKSFWKLQQVEIGFETERLLTLRVAPPAGRYVEEPRRRAYYRQVLEQVEAVPGVVSAGAINLLPMTPGGLGLAYSTPENPVPAGTPGPIVSLRQVSEGYLSTMGIPLLRGRPLTPEDREGAPQVGLVNEAFARLAWGEQDPLGREVRFDDGSEWFTVVGVVGDVRQHRLERASRPEAYRPYGQEAWFSSLFLVVRTVGPPAAQLPSIRQAVWSVDPDVPLSRVASMEEVIFHSTRSPRFFTQLLTLFAGLALALGVVGVYGMVSYAVGLRTREHGIRMALGATGSALVSGAVARGMGPVLLGAALGTGASLLAAGVLESRLYEMSASDPWVLGGCLVVLLLTAGAASYLPARRAAKVDPLESLNAE